MKTQRMIDMHVHTDNSPDGVHSPMYVCEHAVRNNLGAIAFTDHCEVDTYYKDKYNDMVFHSFFECSKARAAFRGQLLVLIGLEIGQPLSDVELADKIVNERPYDFILGSIHTPKGFDGLDIKELPYDEFDVYKFMRNYFTELTELASWKGLDCLSHITAPMRRIEGKYNISFDYSKISSATDALLKEVIANNKSIEINTSGLRQAIGKTMPEESIIRRYKELGGTKITVGSDSHTAHDVGKGIREGILLAKKCGFQKLTFYVKREPIEVEILL